MWVHLHVDFFQRIRTTVPHDLLVVESADEEAWIRRADCKVKCGFLTSGHHRVVSVAVYWGWVGLGRPGSSTRPSPMMKRCAISVMAKGVEPLRGTCRAQEPCMGHPRRRQHPSAVILALGTGLCQGRHCVPSKFLHPPGHSDCSRDSGFMLVLLSARCFKTTHVLP